ncbi:MAG TPA: nucleotidyltransferase family protein [Candidatus Tectomicrobia bacterium]|jgi:hypothetical protein
MLHSASCEGELAPQSCAFYRQALGALHASQVPFLVGGAHAFGRYTGIIRDTKDVDIFIHPDNCVRILEVLQAAGYHTELTFPHWLGKAFSGEHCIDVIFSSGNGIAQVDDEWFTHAIPGDVFGLAVQLCPPEEMLWSKSYVMERERYDGADIAHLLRAYGERFDWPRLLARFGAHWRVLLNHLILFSFAYPSEQSRLPTWVMQELIYRLQRELHNPPPTAPICQGTLLSRAQYRVDIDHWKYQDARLIPLGKMTAADIEHWTAAIAGEDRV